MSCGTSAGGVSAKLVLSVRNLSIGLKATRNSEEVPVLTEVSFEIPAGCILGLFGESGCGKTTLAQALPGLLPASRYAVAGSIEFDGRQLMGASESELQRVRGAGIGMVFQDPLLSLNPVLSVRRQIDEARRAHAFRGEQMSGAEGLLESVGLPASRRILGAYPHQLSGGERQRVAIALALACRPALVIADEPFTALDPARVLELAALFRELKEKLGISLLLIDHSPAVVARIADQLLVMYAGRIVERGTPAQVIGGPLHPYTRGLLHAMPRAGALPTPIPGNPPDPGTAAAGCAFEPRCADRFEPCAARPPAEYAAEDHRFARCFKYGG